MNVKEGHYRINNQELWCNLIYSGNGDFRPTLVFLHDALGSVAGWKTFPLNLCQKLQLNGLIYDRKGHGKSETFEGNYKRDYMQEEALYTLPAVLKEFKINNPIFIGHSDGGTIALIFESMFKRSIAIVSIAGHAMVEEVTREGIIEAVDQFERPDIYSRLQKYHGDKTKQLVSNWQEIWLSDEFSSWDISANISSIECPCLIMQGMEDEYATPKHARLIADSVGTNAELILMEGLKHFPHRESPEKVINEVNLFINKMILPQ